MKKQEDTLNQGDLLLAETHILSNVPNSVVAKFAPQYEGPYKVVGIVGVNLRFWKEENFMYKY